MEIPEATHVQIQDLCAEGDDFMGMGDFHATKKYISALELVPEPKESFAATIWIVAALGDLYFQARNYDQAVQVLSDAMHCTGAIGNPFLHLRLGQAQFEQGSHERVADELCRACMGAGREIFAAEDERYFSFLKTRMATPQGGRW